MVVSCQAGSRPIRIDGDFEGIRPARHGSLPKCRLLEWLVLVAPADSWRLVFVLRDLEVGGAERATIRLANYAARQGVDTHIVVLTGTGALRGEVDSRVSLHDVRVRRIRGAALPLRRLLTRLRPDAVMATLPQVNALTVMVARSMTRRPRVTVREANDPRYEAPYSRRFGSLFRHFLAWTYRRADAVIAVSEGVREGVISTYGVRPDRVIAIANASLDDEIGNRALEHLGDGWYSGLERRVVCVARFSEQKDHATLLEAFRRLNRGPEVGLVLVGGGPLEAALRSRIDELGLNDRVKMVTGETNPFRWLRSAHALVLSSRWEGSPNVLVEAMALGVPVVATDCPSGPREILAAGRFGELVPVGDPQALAEALARTLARPVASADLIERSQEFHIERVGPRWLAALR